MTKRERAKYSCRMIGATYEANPGNRSLIDDRSDMAEAYGFDSWSAMSKELRAEAMLEWRRGRRDEKALSG